MGDGRTAAARRAGVGKVRILDLRSLRLRLAAHALGIRPSPRRPRLPCLLGAAPRTHGGPAVSIPGDATLAVLIRQTQWLLDDVAHDLPAGRVTPDKGAELAGLLEDLAALIRRRTRCMVIDPEL